MWRHVRPEFLLRRLRAGACLIDALDLARQGRPADPGSLRYRIRNLEARCAELWTLPCFTGREFYIGPPRNQHIRDRIHRLMQDIRSLDAGKQADHVWEFFMQLPCGRQLSDKITFCEDRMSFIEQCVNRAE